MTNEIGHRHKQVERLPGRKQAGAAFGRPDRGERIPDQSAKHLAAKRRREPSCADEAREFHLDLFAGLFRHGLFDGTAFAATQESGEAILGAGGDIIASAREASNVDIADEFSKLIVTQQAYAANTRIVTTADQMLQETINMIR